VLLFVGFVLPLPIGWLLISRLHADLALSLIGLTSLPLLVWGASLGAKIGPCGVPDCMSSTQHSHLVVSIVALVLLVGAFVALGLKQMELGGGVLIVSQIVGAYSMLKTDLAAAILLAIFAALGVAYLGYRYSERNDELRVPDFPPAA
jgi:hypothetical protein